MPDVDEISLGAWWIGKDKVLRDTVTREEALETWPADSDPRIIETAVILGRTFDGLDDAAVDRLGRPENLTRLRYALAYMRASRRLRIMHWLSVFHTTYLRKILNREPLQPPGTPGFDADTDRLAAQTLGASLSLLQRQGVLTKMFSAKNVILILDALTAEE